MKNKDRVTSSATSMVEWRRKEDCDVCAYYTGGSCYKNGMECIAGMAQWLYQESNPMPEIKVGDIVDTIYYALVAIDHNVFVRSATREKMELNDVGKIERIWRFNSEGEYEMIWRADK